MENFEGNVEVDSVVDLELEVCEDPTDPVTELLRAEMLDNGVDPILARRTEAMAVGPRTDADACQADAQWVATLSSALSRAGDPQSSSLVRPVWP